MPESVIYMAINPEYNSIRYWTRNAADAQRMEKETGCKATRYVAEPAAVARPVGPDHCPITGRKFWGNIEHPELGLVATYGGPFDTFTIPAISDDGELRCERFDQDAGDWVEGGEPAGWLFDKQPDAAPTPQAAPSKPYCYADCQAYTAGIEGELAALRKKVATYEARDALGMLPPADALRACIQIVEECDPTNPAFHIAAESVAKSAVHVQQTKQGRT